MLFPSILVLSLLQWADAPCAILPNSDVHLVVEPDAVKVDTGYTLDQIAGLALEMEGPKRRRPLGFYVGTFTDTIAVDFVAGSGSGCMSRVRIEVRIQIANRRIAIGRELIQKPCLFAAALKHYKLKAEADEAAIVRYANALGSTLSTMTLPTEAIQNPDAFYATGKKRVEELVTSLIEQSIEPLHAARIASEQAVDLPNDEIRPEEACHLPGPPVFAQFDDCFAGPQSRHLPEPAGADSSGNFLDRLLQAELSGREGRRVKTSLKLSNLRLGRHWRTSTSPFSRR
jgi:hypothetical protein